MSPELTAALATLITAVAGALVLLIRTLGDLAKMRHEMRRELTTVRAELTPNHGSSARDAIARTEAATHGQTEILGEIRRDVGGLRQDVRRLAAVDDADRARADEEHRRIWAELGKSATTPPHPGERT